MSQLLCIQHSPRKIKSQICLLSLFRRHQRQLKDIINSIRSGDESQIKSLYSAYRSEFTDWAMKNFSASEHQAADAFQEAVVIFYLNCKRGKIITLESSVKTYLFAIGKNVLSNKIRKENKEIRYGDDSDTAKYYLTDLTVNPFELNERQEMLSHALARLGDRCRQLLKLFYYEENSMEAIATKMDLKNENVAKSQKLRCLKALKEIMKN